MAQRNIQPFTNQVWEAEGALIGNQDYSGTPGASIGATSSTFTAPVRNVVVNGNRYRIEFDRWSWTYGGTFPGWAGRITANGPVLSVDNSFDDVDEGVLSGTLTVVAHMLARLLSPDDPHWDDDVYYYVTTTSQGNGTTSGDGRYLNHTHATITATPDPNWRFVKWVSSAGDTVTTKSHTFYVSQDITWTAYFEEIEVWVRTGQNVIGETRCSSVAPINLHKFKCGDTVSLAAYVNSPYSADWQFQRWTDPDGSTSATASRSFTLTESYIDDYSTPYGQGEKVLAFVARFVPKTYTTFKLEIAKGTGLGTLPTIQFGAAFLEFVTVLSNTSAKFEARVPFWIYDGDTILPTITDPSKGELRKAVVVAGATPGEAISAPPLNWEYANELVLLAACGSNYGIEVNKGSAPNGVSVAYYLGYKSTGELLYGTSGELLYGSDGDLLYL